MRIVIDMQGAQTESRFRGIGRYTMSFVKAVIRNRGDHEIILALSGLFPETIEPIRAAFEGLLPQENIRVWYAPGPVREQDPDNSKRRGAAELLREAFLASLRPDVIHVCSLFEGYVDDAVVSIGRFDTKTPVSVILYDLIPLLNPETYLQSNPKFESYYLRKVSYLRQASKFLAISDFTRHEGHEHLDIPEEKAVTISAAAEPFFQQQALEAEEAAEIKKKFGICRPLILYTGGSDKRKNLPRLVEAYSALPKELRNKYQLLLAGKMPESHIIQLKKIAHGVALDNDELILTDFISDTELVQLYNLCEVYVFPSWHEGFGLPALEAMACGAPVIGSNTSSLPEVIGLADALFDPFDVASISQKLAQTLKNEHFRDSLRRHGLRQAKKFSWDETAERALSTWEDMQNKSRMQSLVRAQKNAKPRLAFVSPLPPEQTGIANYSAELLPALAEFYEIEIVVDQDFVDSELISKFGTARDAHWLRANIEEIDRVLYQFGNSPFHAYMLPLIEEIPGTVVLHDFYLSALMAWLEINGSRANSWVRALYESHGYCAVLDRYKNPEKTKNLYPVNWHILQRALGVIVHSDYSVNLARKWYGENISLNFEVIPLLRSPAESIDKDSSRKRLGIALDDFVVCSFGFIDDSKLNHRLLRAWLGSELAENIRGRLFFVGANHAGDYGTSLSATIRKSGMSSRIDVTGFVSPEIYRLYLAAADLAVQLRTNSRGETSAAVLDCMNFGLPVVVNANASMVEICDDAVWMMSEEFSDAELVNALETLWRDSSRRKILGDQARDRIVNYHAPNECAKCYADAIERFYQCAEVDVCALIRAIITQNNSRLDHSEIVPLSQDVACNLPLRKAEKRIFLDMSATVGHDLKTGIERVALVVLMSLLESPPAGYRIEPVYLTDIDGVWSYCYARSYTLNLLGCADATLSDEVVDPENGDILLVLDISGDRLIQAERNGLYKKIRSIGVAVYSIVYDLLPIYMPDFFPLDASALHIQWLQSVANFDGAFCISKSVADDLISWMESNHVSNCLKRPFYIDWFHLGADFNSLIHSSGLQNNAKIILSNLNARPSFLMVGTVEPRKGYLQVIEAFSLLWSEAFDINLVIVGSQGWQHLPDSLRRDIPQTVKILRNHSEKNQRLFWLEGVSDEYLEMIYSASTCLIAASYGEGFGLPLIEAGRRKLPIIARDIRIFREVLSDHAFYFSDERSPDVLADCIRTWLNLHYEGKDPKSDGMHWQTWNQSVQQLLRLIFAKQNLSS
jgi:glycosyltransferase involved in cell wall biosynthesis